LINSSTVWDPIRPAPPIKSKRLFLKSIEKFYLEGTWLHR
jgi:hypothetical protein